MRGDGTSNFRVRNINKEESQESSTPKHSSKIKVQLP